MKILIASLIIVSPLFAKNFKFDRKTGQAVPEYVAELKIMRGNVYRLGKDKLPQAVKIGTKFKKEDGIITEEKSFAKIVMVDDTILTIGANSEFNFDDFEYESKEKRNSLVTLVKGQVRAMVKNPVKDGELLFKTRNGVMAVRGTELFINHHIQNSVEISEFALTSGTAEITDQQSRKTDLIKSERLLIAKKPTMDEWIMEKNQLAPSEYDTIIIENEVMPFYEVARIGKDSALWSLFNRNNGINSEDTSRPGKTNSDADQGIQEQKGLKHNLDKLNQQLKDNQKNTNPFN